MEKNIYLPDAETAAKLIDNAWQEFCQQMKDNGMDIVGTKVESLVHDVFVGGYAYGHNDCLTIIRDQLNIDNWMKFALNNKEN